MFLTLLHIIIELICSLCFCFSYQDPKQLFQACKKGDLEAVLELLAAGVGVDIEDTVRFSVLWDGGSHEGAEVVIQASSIVHRKILYWSLSL